MPGVCIYNVAHVSASDYFSKNRSKHLFQARLEAEYFRYKKDICNLWLVRISRKNSKVDKKNTRLVITERSIFQNKNTLKNKEHPKTFFFLLLFSRNFVGLWKIAKGPRWTLD